MRKQRGIKVELINKTFVQRLFGGLFSQFSLKTFAEETDPNTNNEDDESGDSGDSAGTKPPTINYEDLISKARKEEKDKQYKKIEKLTTQNTALTEQHNKDLIKIASLEKELETLKTKLSTAGDSDSEAVKTLKGELATVSKEKEALENKVAELEKNKPVSREEIESDIRAELEAEYEVKTYKTQKLIELKDELLVPELVIGTTKEEIDDSLNSALERSKQIRESLGLTDKKTKRTPKNPTNPDVSGVQDNKYSLEHLATLDPASKEYAQVRKELGLY